MTGTDLLSGLMRTTDLSEAEVELGCAGEWVDAHDALERALPVTATTRIGIDLGYTQDLSGRVVTTLGDAYDLLVNYQKKKVLRRGVLCLRGRVLVQLDALNEAASALIWKTLESQGAAEATVAASVAALHWPTLGNVVCSLATQPSELDLALIPHLGALSELDSFTLTQPLQISYDGDLEEEALFGLIQAYLYALGRDLGAFFEICQSGGVLQADGEPPSSSGLRAGPVRVLPAALSHDVSELVAMYMRGVKLSQDSDLFREAYLAYYRVLEHAATAAGARALKRHIDDHGHLDIKGLKSKATELSSDKGQMKALLEEVFGSRAAFNLLAPAVSGGSDAASALGNTRDLFSHAKRNYSIKDKALFSAKPGELLSFMHEVAAQVLSWFATLPEEYRE